MKNIFIIFSFIFLSLCSGCATLLSGVDLPAFPVKEKRFEDFIGRRYKVIKPLIIGRFSDSWVTFLSTPMSSTDGKTIANVPSGSTIVIDHVSKSYSFALEAIGLDGIVYYYIARLEDPKIFKGKFKVDYLMIFERDKFIGMDPAYLVEDGE